MNMPWARTHWPLWVGILGLLGLWLSGDMESASTTGMARVIGITLAFLALLVLPDERWKSWLAWFTLGASVGFVVLGGFGYGLISLLPLLVIIAFLVLGSYMPDTGDLAVFFILTTLGMLLLMPLF